MTSLDVFLNSLKSPLMALRASYETVKHYHRCPKCSKVWAHTREEVRASGDNEAAHTCKCGGQDFYAKDTVPKGTKIGRSLKPGEKPKPPKGSTKPKSEFLKQLESL